MPIFFAAVAHRELSLGNISFEFYKGANHIERIAVFEIDTIEKIFTTPEKYKMVYVNVSSNQKEVVGGLANIFDVNISAAEPPMERVKKLGAAIGSWWRSLPKHAQISENISEEAKLVRDFVFRLLADPEKDAHKILLQDIFENVFDVSEKVQKVKVQRLISPIKSEFDNLLPKLHGRILAEYQNVFGGKQSDQEASEVFSQWFQSLPEEKKNAVFSGETGTLMKETRKNEVVDDEILLRAAHKITGLELASWGDEMVLKFSGKIDTIKQNVEKYVPPQPVTPTSLNETPSPPDPGYACVSLMLNGKNNQRTFEPVQKVSQNAQALENMLNLTTDQLARGLDEREKITIIVKFMNKHIFGLDLK